MGRIKWLREDGQVVIRCLHVGREEGIDIVFEGGDFAERNPFSGKLQVIGEGIKSAELGIPQVTGRGEGGGEKEGDWYGNEDG